MTVLLADGAYYVRDPVEVIDASRTTRHTHAAPRGPYGGKRKQNAERKWDVELDPEAWPVAAFALILAPVYGSDTPDVLVAEPTPTWAGPTDHASPLDDLSYVSVTCRRRDEDRPPET